MAVRVRVRIQTAAGPKKPPVETVAVANSGFEAKEPAVLLPVRVAERLGLWPPPPAALAEQFESPAAAFTMLTLPKGVRVGLVGSRARAVSVTAVLSEHETEVILNDRLVEALGIELIAVGRGLYRVGRRGKLRVSESPERW